MELLAKTKVAQQLIMGKKRRRGKKLKWNSQPVKRKNKNKK